jgi:hypothetical protein
LARCQAASTEEATGLHLRHAVPLGTYPLIAKLVIDAFFGSDCIAR